MMNESFADNLTEFTDELAVYLWGKHIPVDSNGINCDRIAELVKEFLVERVEKSLSDAFSKNQQPQPQWGQSFDVTVGGNGDLMPVELEAHWRYQLEHLTDWGHFNQYAAPWNTVPDEVLWLREQARYHCHLADAQLRRAPAVPRPLMPQ